MCKKHWLALAVLIGGITLGLGVAQSQPPKPPPPPLVPAVAAAANLPAADVAKILNVLGPEINTDETYRYDANGRLHIVERKQGTRTITTTCKLRRALAVSARCSGFSAEVVTR